jgi:hypothetical protein
VNREPAGGRSAPPGGASRASVPRVGWEWSRVERRGARLCRWSNRFRMRYTVRPGLYALGEPDPEAPVLVTANYRLSFDLLRRGMAGLSAWVLVLDTAGINVWCAAGKGTFGTEELTRRVLSSGLQGLVSHRRLILPQLGAPGVQAHLVERATGFSVRYGPVRAVDLPAYLEAGGRATPEMRTVGFPLRDRLALAPMELVHSLRPLAWIVGGTLALLGLAPQGILFARVLASGLPFALMEVAAVLAGTILFPLLLPWLPGRAFALKGWILGIVVTLPFSWLQAAGPSGSLIRALLALAAFPALVSFMGYTFTGSTPFTSLSGVRRELRLALPGYILSAVASTALLVLAMMRSWR